MDTHRCRAKFARLLTGDAEGAEQLGAQLAGEAGEPPRDGSDGSADPLLLAMLMWHEDISYALYSYIYELCQQHAIREGHLALTLDGAAAEAGGGEAAAEAAAGEADGGSESRQGEEGGGDARGTEGDGEEGNAHLTPPDVRAAVLAEIRGSGFLGAFRALVSEGRALVQQARESAEEERGEGGGRMGGRPERALPLLDMFGTVHRLTDRVVEWVGECERVGENGEASEGVGKGEQEGEGEQGGKGEQEGGVREWEQLEGEVAAAAMAAMQASRDDIMAELRAVAAQCTPLQGVAGGFKQADSLRRQYSIKSGRTPSKLPGGKAGKAASGGLGVGADPLTIFVVDRIRQYCCWDTKHTLLGAAISSSSSRRPSLRRLTSTPAPSTCRSLVLPASSVSAVYPSPSPAAREGGGATYPSPAAGASAGNGDGSAPANASSTPLPNAPSPAKPSPLPPLSPRGGTSTSNAFARGGGEGGGAGRGGEGGGGGGEGGAGGGEAAAAGAVDSGCGSSSSSGGDLWSYAQLLDIIFERQPDDFPDWQDLAVETVEGLWMAIQAKAPLVAAAVADSGDGGEGRRKKKAAAEEEKKPRRKGGFFGLGLKEGKDKGGAEKAGGSKAGGESAGAGGGAGGGAKGDKVPVQEILRGLYLFNNAAHIQQLVSHLRLSKEFRELSDTTMHRFLDVLLQD
ncbi:hypothetical protein CLOM_g1213, partial [Closterium sp. NIES-68]